MEAKKFFSEPKEIILTIALILALGSLCAITFSLEKTLHLLPKAQTVSPAPREVKITNLNPRGFTLTWETGVKAKGAVVYGDSRETIEKKDNLYPRQDDERGNGFFYLHSVRITNLEPGKKYYFKIISGDLTFFKSLNGDWNEAGVAETVDLPGDFANQGQGGKSNETENFLPNPIYGEVMKEGQPAQEALIYLEIPGKSNLLSVLSDTKGKWSLNLGNLLKNDLSGYLLYQTGTDLIKITARGPQKGEVSSYRSIPPLTKMYQDQTNPVSLSLMLPPNLPQSTITLSPTVTPTDTPVGTINLALKLGDQSLKGNFKYATLSVFRGKTLLSTNKIKINSQGEGLYQGQTPLFYTGEFTLLLKPDGYLRHGLGSYKLNSGPNSLNLNAEEFLGGDLNADNQINTLDLSLLLYEMNQPKITLTAADLNGDGKVNSLDFAILTNNYRQTGE